LHKSDLSAIQPNKRVTRGTAAEKRASCRWNTKDWSLHLVQRCKE